MTIEEKWQEYQRIADQIHAYDKRIVTHKDGDYTVSFENVNMKHRNELVDQCRNILAELPLEFSVGDPVYIGYNRKIEATVLAISDIESHQYLVKPHDKVFIADLIVSRTMLSKRKSHQ